MSSEAAVMARVRRELGDIGESFQNQIRGNGADSTFDVPVGPIDATSFKAFLIPANGGQIVQLQSADYQLDTTNNSLTLATAPADGDVLMVQGSAYAIFSDDELRQYVNDAFLQHTNDRTIDYRYRDAGGWTHYDKAPVTWDTLPDVEELLVALLATVLALWTLATDASTDVDVSTAEGTHLSRSQRYAQIRSQIDVLEARYADLCQQLNVGLHRIEMATLRRVSKSTGRFVPIYEEREYDDHEYPRRILPPIDRRHVDESGIPSPAYMGYP